MAKKPGKKSSRKKPAKPAKKGGPKVGKPTGGSMKLPAASAIKALSKSLEAYDRDASKASKSKTELMAGAVTNQGIDRKAMSIAQSLKKMKRDNALAITLAHLPFYIEQLGLEERASKQGDMVGIDPKRDANGGGNVARPNFSAAGDEHLKSAAAAPNFGGEKLN